MRTITVAALVAALLAAAAAAGELLQPTERLAALKPPIDLAADVPERIGRWRVTRVLSPVLPDPTVEAMLDSVYAQVLARTYVSPEGEVVMLSIAYGGDQGSDATAVHRPEFCYRAGGFQMDEISTGLLQLGGREIPVRRMVAVLGSRREPITYWITLDDTVTLPGIGRKLAQLRYGLSGRIADGMLVRVSTLGGTDDAAAYELQAAFLRELHELIPEPGRSRYFGALRRPAG